MASKSSQSQDITARVKKKLEALPAPQRATLSHDYVVALRTEIEKCLTEHHSALLPKEITEDILSRPPTNFQKWRSMVNNIWDGSSDGTTQYGDTAVVHRGYDIYHSTIFINNQDFFKTCPWTFSELFEYGFINGFFIGQIYGMSHCWGIDVKNLDGLAPAISQEIKQWVRRHKSITIWVETITPEWSSDYTQIYPPIHLLQIIPSSLINDWKISHWPARPRIRSNPT